MRPLAAICCLLVVLIAGCDRVGGRPDSQQPDQAAGPLRTATGEPAPSGQPIVRTSLQGSCQLTPTGADIRVEYSVITGGSTMLTRVKLLEDGREVEDSGVLEQRTFRRVSVFHVEPGDQRTYRIAAEARGASAANVQTTVRCGSVATPTPGPRA